MKGISKGTSILPFAEDLGADADECGAFVHGDVPVVAHAHGEFGERHYPAALLEELSGSVELKHVSFGYSRLGTVMLCISQQS